MPLYEYQCESCGHRFEVIQKFSDAAPVCPKCGGAVEKLVSSPAIQFKGSGFYLTDYGRGGKSDMAPSNDGKASAGEKAEKADRGADEKATRPTRPTRPRRATRRQGRQGRQGREDRQERHRPVQRVERRVERRQDQRQQARRPPAHQIRLAGYFEKPCSARYLRNGSARSGRRSAK